MTFLNVRLKDTIEQRATASISYKTDITPLISGAEQRNASWLYPVYRWNFSFATDYPDDHKEVIDMFYAVGGRELGFRFKNWTDFVIGSPTSGAVIAIGDALTTRFQICQVYNSGTKTSYKPVTRISSDVVPIVWLGTTVQLNTTYTIDYNTGVLTFNTAPLSGVSILIYCEYDTPVRFDTDRAKKTSRGYIAFSVDELSIIELREPNILPIRAPVPSFNNTLCLDKYKVGSTVSTMFLTNVQRASSGYETRKKLTEYPKQEYSISFPDMEFNDIKNITDLFHVSRGRHLSFLFKDPFDNSIQSNLGLPQLTGTADGTKTQFQIYKLYVTGSVVRLRRITKPIIDSFLAVHINGFPSAINYTVNPLTGIITFASPPASGDQVAVACNFLVAARFDTDTLDISHVSGLTFFVSDVRIVETF